MVKKQSAGRRLVAFLLMFFALAAGVVIGGGTSRAYAEEARYDGYLDTGAMEGLPLYVSPQGSRDYGEVAYCFNFDKHFPNERGSSQNKFSHYTKQEGTAANFVAMAQNPRLNTSLSGTAQAEDFRAKVLRVLYNGYPRDMAGLKAKYHATDGQLRMATQHAVWYFTDSQSLDTNKTSYASVISMRQELVNMAETTVLPDNFKLDIYEPQNVTDATGYQNLLTTGIYYGTDPDTPVPTVQPTTVAVKISKTKVGETVQLQGAALKLVKGESAGGTQVESWTSVSSVKTISLEAGIYTLVETKAPDGFEIADPITFRVTSDGSVELKTENGWNSAADNTVHMEDEAKAVEKVEINVSKQWIDQDNQDGRRANSVTITLFADGKKTNKTVMLSNANQWQNKFTDLDKKNDKGAEITYTVQENDVDGYRSNITGTALTGFVIKNSHVPEKTSVKGSKTWNDNNNQDGARPDSITVRLHKDGTEVDSKTVTADDNWSWEFTGLDKYRDQGTEINYTITEDAVDGYTTEVNGYNVENSYTPKKTSVFVTKQWVDGNDQDKLRPDSIKVILYADGQKTDQSITLTADEKWAGSFAELDRYKAGKEIHYTVKEEPVKGYEAVVTGDTVKGYTISNTHNVSSKNSAKTGDDTMLLLYGIIALTAAGGAVAAVVLNRRKKA